MIEPNQLPNPLLNLIKKKTKIPYILSSIFGMPPISHDDSFNSIHHASTKIIKQLLI